MKRILIVLMLCCILLTGCNERQVEEELLVIVLAIDQTEDHRCLTAIKVPANTSASSSSSDREDSGYLLLQAEGDHFADAISMLNATTPRRLNFSQVREVIIGEAVSKQTGFITLLQQIDNLPRFRCSAAVIICQGEAMEFIKQQKPYVGMRLSRYAENTLASNAGKGFTPSTDLCAGVRDLGFGFSDPLFILGAVNSFNHSENQSEEKSLDTKAGSLPRKSLEAIEMFGAAATDGISVCGYISGYEMALIHLLSGHVEALTMQQGSITLHITVGKPASLSVDISQTPIVLHISLQCEALYSPGSNPDIVLVQNQLQKDLLTLISHLQSIRCDGIGFGDVAVKNFLTIPDWESFNWRVQYAQAAVQAEVKVLGKEK